jgi:hypothetical protein
LQRGCGILRRGVYSAGKEKAAFSVLWWWRTIAMFDRYLSEGLYENLPRLHVAAAVLVALSPLSPVRWVAVASLLLASWLMASRRRRYRRNHLRLVGHFGGERVGPVPQRRAGAAPWPPPGARRGLSRQVAAVSPAARRGPAVTIV